MLWNRLPRQGLRLALSFALALSIPISAAQAEYPKRSIEFLVGVAPGSSSDALARMIASHLSTRTNQSVIVVNKPGASTRLAVDHVMRAAPDGYTVGLLYAQASIFHLMFDNIERLRAGQDFTPISTLALLPTFVGVPSTSAATNLGALLDITKKSPHPMNFGITGTGSNNTLAMRQILNTKGSDATPIAYKGGVPLALALAKGEIDFGPVDYVSARGLLDNKSIRLLAVMGPNRSALAPEVPALPELGLSKNISGSAWMMLIAPPNLPADIAHTLHTHVNHILQQEDVRKTLDNLGMEPLIKTREDAGKHFESEQNRMTDILQQLNISLK